MIYDDPPPRTSGDISVRYHVEPGIFKTVDGQLACVLKDEKTAYGATCWIGTIGLDITTTWDNLGRDLCGNEDFDLVIKKGCPSIPSRILL